MKTINKTIYISHSHNMNYEDELYKPLLDSKRAECNNIPIICIIKKGFKCSSSVKRNFKVIEYFDSEDMIKKLENIFLKKFIML